MGKAQAWNNLDDLEKSYIASLASENGSVLDSEGNNVNIKDCAIDTNRISMLNEYLADQRMKEGKEVNLDLRDDNRLARRYVIPLTLPNGQEIEVIVNQNGQDEACMYRDEQGNTRAFELTPRMKKAIQDMTPENLRDIVGEEMYKAGILPDTLDAYAEKVQKDELIPRDKKHAMQMVGISTQEERESQEQEKEAEEAKKEIPSEARDIISRICSEQGLDISTLKEVMEVEPEVIKDNLENTGIRENNGRVYCLRFRDGANLQGRVVMVQGDKTVDERKYDDYMNSYMNEHKGQKRIKEVEDEHDKLVYTDLDGNTTVCEITREPRDLNCTEKELLQQEMKRLDDCTDQILNSDMPLELKTQEIIKINQKRIDLFKEHGIEVPTVQNEIEADIEISEDVQNIAVEESEGQDDYDDNEGGYPTLPEGPWDKPGKHY